MIRHETEIVPAILSNPFNFVRTVMSIFKRHTKKKSIVTARNTTLHKVLQISNEYTYDDVSKIQKINLPADISCTCKPFTANARRNISKTLIKHETKEVSAMLSDSTEFHCRRHILFKEKNHNILDFLNASQQKSYAITTEYHDPLKNV